MNRESSGTFPLRSAYSTISIRFLRRDSINNPDKNVRSNERSDIYPFCGRCGDFADLRAFDSDSQAHRRARKIAIQNAGQSGIVCEYGNPSFRHRARFTRCWGKAADIVYRVALCGGHHRFSLVLDRQIQHGRRADWCGGYLMIYDYTSIFEHISECAHRD